jgi:hypothetical protein
MKQPDSERTNMEISTSIKVKASKERLWKTITNFNNLASVFKDIKAIEIIEKPQDGIMGLKWKETRALMGKKSTETMWITNVEENKSYTSEAKNSGCLYQTSISLMESDGEVIVMKTFKATPLTIFAKLMIPLMLLMKGTLKKCLAKDIGDLKTHIESES